MAENTIEVKVKLVADKSSAAQVQNNLKSQLSILESATEKVKGKKGAKARLDLSDIEKDISNLETIDPSQDTERYNLAWKKINDKIVSFVKGLYLSLQKNKKIVGKIEDVEKKISDQEGLLSGSKEKEDSLKSEYDDKTDSKKSGFRVGKYDTTIGQKGYHAVERAYMTSEGISKLDGAKKVFGNEEITRASLKKRADSGDTDASKLFDEVQKKEKEFAASTAPLAVEITKASNSTNDYKEKVKKLTESLKDIKTGKAAEKVLGVREQAQSTSTALGNAIDDKRAGEKQNKENHRASEALAAEAAEEQEKLASAITNSDNAQKAQTGTIGKAIKSFFGYQQVIRALRTVINFTINTITGLDKALTDQAIVSNLSRKQAWALVDSYSALAKQTGFTTTEIANTASKFLQQGKTVAETLTLTKAAAESARVAGISASQAVDYLTTALNGFKMSANQSIEVSDKFAALAAASATSYEELAVALSKVASQASLAGMSMDYTLALLAKGVETTRESAESIGTALKTVIARMREIKDYNETLEDGVDLNNVETQLSTVGISLRDANGELRSTEDVLNELGIKWDGLSKNQQAAIAKALAGTRQQSRLISMMSDYGRTLELLQISQDSLGATEAQQAKYMQGMAAATNSVQVAWQDLVTSFTSADAIVGIVNTFASAIQLLKEQMQFLIPVMITLLALTLAESIAMKVTAAKIKVKAGLELMEALAKNTQNSAEMESQALQGKGVLLNGFSLIQTMLLAASIKAKTHATWGAVAAQLAENGAMYACPLVWFLALIIAIVAVTALFVIGIWAIVKALSNQKSASEIAIDNMKKLTAEAYNFKKAASDFDSVVNAFDKVDSKIIKTADDMASLSSTAAKAKELLNNLNTSDSRNSGLLKSIFGTDDKDAIASMIESASTEQLADWSKTAAEENKKLALQSYRDIIKNSKVDGVLDTEDGLKYTKNAVNNLGSNSISEAGAKTGMTTARIQNVAQAWNQMVNSMTKEDLAGDVEAMGNDFADVMSKMSGDTIDTFFDSSAKMSDRIKAYEEMYKAVPDDLKDDFEAAYSQFNSLIKNYNSAITSGIIDDLGISVDSLNTFNTALNNLGLKNATLNGEMLNTAGQLLKLGASYDEIVKKLMEDYRLTKEQAEGVAKATAVAASNGKTLLDATATQSSLESQASNLRETQSKWSTMSNAEKNEYIAKHSSFFKNENARKAFENGSDITSYIKSTYGEDQQKLIQEYTNQSIQAQGRMSEAQKEMNAALAAGDEHAYKSAKEKYDAAQEEYREAEEFKKDAVDMFNISLDEIVKKQQSQISTYKNFLKQQQTDLIDSLNARKEAYQDYFDAINAAYDEQNFASEEQRIQEQIVKFSTGTDATSQNKVLELTNKLTELQKNHSEEQRKNAQQAVLNNIDDEISKVNNYYDKVLNNDSKMLALMNQWLASGKSRDEYEAYLTKLGYTDEEKQQSLKTFDTLYADGKGAGSWMNDPENTKATQENTASLDQVTETMKSFQALQLAQVASSMVDKNGNVATIKNENGGMTVNFAGETYTLGSDKGHTVSDIIMAMLKNAKFATKVG